MRLRPLTMGDVARKVGVSASTVSLALREHHSIPLATRSLIRQVANQLGYRRDALLDAFNALRHKSDQALHTRSTAFVVHTRSPNRQGGFEQAQLIFAGAREAAKASGHSLDYVTHGGGESAGTRLREILEARGYGSLILLNVSSEAPPLAGLERLCTVLIDAPSSDSPVDLVTHAHMDSARLLVKKLRQRGYRRIGLACSPDQERPLGRIHRMALKYEQATMPRDEQVEPLLLEGTGILDSLASARAWMEGNQVDVVITNGPHLSREISYWRGLLTRDLALASLELCGDDRDITGIRQDHALLGRTAMEQVAVRVESGARGPQAHTSISCIAGLWNEGETAPALRS